MVALAADPPPAFASRPSQIRWNPLYWLCFLPLIPCILLGKWLHSMWGQGDMMREDETIEETRVRLHWVYCLDGPIAAALFLDLIDVLFDVPLYTQRKFQSSVLSWCMTLMVTGAYILANSYFLDVMRRRSLVGVRLVIVYQTVFAVGLLNMLVAVRLQWLLNSVWEGSQLTHSLRVCCVRVCRARCTTRTPTRPARASSSRHGWSSSRGLPVS